MRHSVTTLAIHLALAGATALTIAALPRPADASPQGVWRAIDDASGKPSARIRLSESQGVITGRIEEVLMPAPQSICTECRDERKDQPLKGLVILRNVKASDEPNVWQGGDILDPKNGKVYKVRLEEIDGGAKLKVRGYIGSPILGRTQVWNRETP